MNCVDIGSRKKTFSRSYEMAATGEAKTMKRAAGNGRGDLSVGGRPSYRGALAVVTFFALLGRHFIAPSPSGLFFLLPSLQSAPLLTPLLAAAQELEQTPESSVTPVVDKQETITVQGSSANAQSSFPSSTVSSDSSAIISSRQDGMSLSSSSDSALLLEGAGFSRLGGSRRDRRERSAISDAFESQPDFPLYDEHSYYEDWHRGSDPLSERSFYDSYDPSGSRHYDTQFSDNQHHHYGNNNDYNNGLPHYDSSTHYNNNNNNPSSFFPILPPPLPPTPPFQFHPSHPVYPQPPRPSYSEMCCADCPEGNIRCLSRCVRTGCTAANTCSNAGKGAYAAFCSRRCETLAGMSLASSIEFLPEKACAGACAGQVQRLCERLSCRDFGCSASDCFELAPLKCMPLY